MFYKVLATLCLLLFLGLWFLTSCRPDNFMDLTDVSSPKSLNVPVAEYGSVAWLDNDTIAFVYRQEEFGDRLGDFRIAVYSIGTNAWNDIPRPESPEHCPHASTVVHELSRLPDGRLGYIYSCSGQRGVFALLYSWDKETGSTRLLQHYSPPFGADAYTFAPDMSELIQENGAGNGMNNELYRIRFDRGGQIEQLFHDFQRVGEPSWSPDGETIAFTGTEVYPRKTDDPKTWDQIEGLLRYPWDLYLMDADGSNVRVILPEAGRPYQLKWVPDDNGLLAFAGDSQGTQGIWLLDIVSRELVRIWPYNTAYDWSPDGQQMVIIVREENGAEHTYPVVIDIPDFEQ